jgi:MFS family permease
MLIVQMMAWLAPAPILVPMVSSLHIGMGQFGLIISIIALCIAIFSFLAGVLAERFSALRTLLLGIWLLAVSEVANGFSPGFGVLLLSRVLEGVGYGFMIGADGIGDGMVQRTRMAVCQHGQRMIAYLGIAALFPITPRVYHARGSSWQRTLTWYGATTVGWALLWRLLAANATGPPPPNRNVVPIRHRTFPRFCGCAVWF